MVGDCSGGVGAVSLARYNFLRNLSFWSSFLSLGQGRGAGYRSVITDSVIARVGCADSEREGTTKGSWGKIAPAMGVILGTG